jgi:hypothetical protein
MGFPVRDAAAGGMLIAHGQFALLWGVCSVVASPSICRALACSMNRSSLHIAPSAASTAPILLLKCQPTLGVHNDAEDVHNTMHSHVRMLTVTAKGGRKGCPHHWRQQSSVPFTWLPCCGNPICSESRVLLAAVTGTCRAAAWHR